MPTAPDVTITPFDLANASESEYKALNDHGNRSRKEVLPDDPETPLEERIAGCQNIPPFLTLYNWSAWTPDKQRIVATGGVGFLNTEENRHVCQAEIDIEPEYRRQGLGRQFLARIAEAARQNERRLIILGSNGRIPAGEAFLNRLGAEKGLENHTNQLVLSELDRSLVREWIESGPVRAPGFMLGVWAGEYPEESLASVVDLMEVMNTAPRGDLEVDDFHWTAEHIRQMEKGMKATGTQKWTIYAQETATGRLAGFTEVTWNPNRPQIVQQGGTGVFPEFRNHGLGRWLKATMLEKILAERPDARFVRTGNADSNGPMLRINHALGFKPYMSHCLWQLATDKAFAYLESQEAAA